MIIEKRTKQAQNYEIEVSQSDPLSAKVTSKYETPRFCHSITLSCIPPTCSYGCLRLLGSPCKEMCTFAKSIHVDIVSLIPSKYTIKGCLEVLMESLQPNHPPLQINKEDLYEKPPIILPPHMRKIRGRPHIKRYKVGDGRSSKCQNCGQKGHNTRTCFNATDGQGNMMESKTQDDYINEGFLVINITQPGTTILPTTLEDFHNMRNKSEYPSLPFHRHVKDHLVCDLSPIQDNNHTSETPEDDIHTSENCPNEGSVDNTPHCNYDTDDSLSHKTSSSTAQNMSLTKCHGTVDTQTGNDIDLFSLPDDVSEYTLDIHGNLSEPTKKKQELHLTKKRDSYSVFNIPEVDEVPKSKEKINVGDVLAYVPWHCVQGDWYHNFHRRTGTVLSVNADAESGGKIEISTGDPLYDEQQVKRKQVMIQNNLVDHPGVFRNISSFDLKTQQGTGVTPTSFNKERARMIIDQSAKKVMQNTPKQCTSFLRAHVVPKKKTKKAPLVKDKNTTKKVTLVKSKKKTKNDYLVKSKKNMKKSNAVKSKKK